MSKRDDFIALIKVFKEASSNVTDEIYKGYLNLAKTDYGLTTQEAEAILKDVGLTVGPSVNYFEALKLNINEIKNLSDTKAEEHILQAYDERYAESRKMSSGNPRKAELQNRLTKAKIFLIDQGKWKQHLQEIVGGAPDDNGNDKMDSPHGTRTIVKFRNGDEATSISQLATLMEKNASEATNLLYRGRLEQGLAGAGETTYADAAEAAVKQFSSDRSIGLMAVVAILRGKIKMRRGNETSTPQQLARLIDQNWEDAKTLLYNGFIGLWLEYTQQSQLASIAKKITNRYRDEQDIGLEELVQRLDPRIGTPEPDFSHSEIDFQTMNTKDKDTIQFKIKNKGRGFLYGDVQIESGLPGLQVSGTEINGNGIVTVALDTSSLTVRKTHKASLVVDTNGGQFKVPISCYVDHPTQQSVQCIAISGLSMAAIAVVTRLIIQQFGVSGWLATRLTGAGFTEWEQHWQWVEWFQWPWFEWKVYTLAAPEAGVGSVIGFVTLGVGSFAYWHFFLRKKSTH